MASITSIAQRFITFISNINKSDIQYSQASEYHKLTPIADADLGEYEKALLYAFEERDVRNIAITGVYGSGKSSLIKSFEYKYKNDARFNFLNVSLASFVIERNASFEKKESVGESNKKNETQDIEKSLLQQIIFKVKSDELEDSQFSRIKVKRFLGGFLTTHFWSAFFLISLLLSSKFIFKPNYFLFNGSWLFKKEYMAYFEIIVLVSVVGLIQLILNWIPKLGLSKLSAGGAEISFNEKKGDSILNKHLDELIYFFTTTRFNIVIFEDLDRLQNREILIKLREINQLINNSEEINHHGKNKIIKFVFALGDDLFTDSIDRTKFFDFIIPVIPVVNYSNSRKKLEDAIRKAFPKNDIKEQFLDEVTQFLDDMRLLFNISNEFIIYKRRLDVDSGQLETKDKLKLDSTKLLALVIYKNKHPDDFASLNKRQGLVWGVLSKKEKLMEQSVLAAKNQISEIKKKIIEIEAETLKDIAELRRSYLAMYWVKHPEMSFIMLDSAQLSPNQLIQDDSLFESFIKHPSLKYRTINNGTGYLESFSDIESEVDPINSYEKRYDLLAKKQEGFISQNKSRVLELEKDIKKSNSLSCHQLVKLNPEFAFNALEEKDSLIKYLILEGLIGEDFLTYITYFYSGELSSNDHQFVISQLSNTPLEIGYQLDRPDKVAEKITEARFRNVAILNLDLLIYLSHDKVNTQQFELFIETIVEAKKLGYQFLYAWLKSEPNPNHIQSVLNKLVKVDETFWLSFFESFEETNDEKDIWVIALLQLLDQNGLKSIDAFLRDELNNNVEIFLLLPTISKERLGHLFKLLEVSFSNLEKCNDSNLLKVIESNDAYALTAWNLVKILSYQTESKIGLIPTYTLILQLGSKHLKEYVQSRLSEYVENVLLQLENAQESESSILELLNSNDLESKLKIDLIRELQFKVTAIEKVDDTELWNSLLEFSKVDASWENVIKYFAYADNEVNHFLIVFLSDLQHAKSLSKGSLRLSVPAEDQLAEKIIHCDAIASDSYRLLLKAIRIIYGNLSDLEVNGDKINILLEEKKFNLSSVNHEFLKASFPDKSYVLIEQYFEDFLKDTSKISILAREFISLLASSSLPASQKLKLLDTIPEDLVDERLAKAIFSFVLDDTDEKPFTIQLVEKVFGFDLSSTLKIKLFNRYAAGFSDSKIPSLVDTLSLELTKLGQGRHSLVSKNEDNLRMAKILDSRGFISFKDYKKDSSFIELIPRKKIKT